MKFDVPSEIINILFEQGYEEQILDMVMASENMPNTEVSDIPISPAKIKDSNDRIIISSKIYQIYNQFLQRINDSNTAKEIPFFLLGNRKEIDGISYIFLEDIIFNLNEALSDTKVSTNVEQFQKLLLEDNYSIISIGHTHGNVSEDKKDLTLARKLPVDLREKYDIRDAGLNISVSDIWQHEAFKQIASIKKSNKEILQTIIMYNGDIVILGQKGIVKANDIQALLENNMQVSISTGIDIQATNKQIK